MQLLLAHWHCILPVIVIVGAMLFMKDKDKEKKDGSDTIKGAATLPPNDED